MILMGPSERDPTVERIREELQILGITVAFIRAPAGSPDLAAVAREHGVPAAAIVEPSPLVIRIWTDPARFPSDGSGPELRIDEGLTGSAEPALLALRAVEVLRGRLIPVSARLLPSPEAGALDAADGSTLDGGRGDGEPSPPVASADAGATPAPPARPVPPAADSRWRGPSAFVGPAVLASPGGVTATPHVWLGARWAPAGRLDLELLAFLPTIAATVSAPEGSARLRIGGAGAGLGLRLTDPMANVFASAGLGLGAMLSVFQGEARPPRVAMDGSRWSALPYARVGAGYWIIPNLALRGDVMAGVAAPEPVLRVAGRRVATFGEPAVVFAAAIEVRP
jgi:hypothetical protein